MSNELKRVGLVFTQEGAVDFKKTLQEINLELNKNYNQFKLTQAQWDKSTTSTEKLRAEQEYLKNAYEIQADKVSTLKMQLSDLENAEDKNTTAIKKKRNELTNAEVKLETYNKRLKEIDSQLNNTGKKIEEFGIKVEKVGGNIEKAGKKLSAFSAATASALVASAKSAIDFEDAFTGVEKTVDGTEEQMAELRQGIRDMAKEIPATTTEISAVAEAAGQLGIKTEDILSFTRVMIDLGNSTNLSAEEAASSLAKFANVTKMSASDYDKLGATIVALGNNFATTEADIVEMATRLAATGELAGLSESQILSLATAMSSVGIEAEAGGSAMSKLLKRIQVAVETGSEDLESFAKVAGMSSSKFKKAFEEDAVSALTSFIAGLNDTERNGKSAISILEDMEITEVRLSNTVLSLANASDVLTEAVELGSEAWEDNTALTEEANKRYNTLKSKMTIAINKIKDIAITLGNKLMPSIEKVIDKIEDLTNWFANLSDEQVDWIVKIGLTVTAIGPLLTIIGKVTSTIGGAIKGIGTFTQAIGVMKGTVTTSSTVVNSLATVITSLSNPTNLAITAVGLLTTATMAYCIAVEKEKVSLDGLRDEVDTQRESWEELGKTRNESLSTSMTEIDYCNTLVDELSKITDENGKVKDGYKERAQVILNELNRALGTEYKLNENIIDNYQNLKENINQVIEVKKAESVLNAYQEEYGEAIKKQAEATETLVGLKIKLKEASEKMATGTALERAEAKQQYESIAREIGEQTELIGEYGKTITDYENLQVASLEGNSEKIKTATDSLTTSYQKVKQEAENSAAEQINTQATYVEYLKQSLVEAEQTNNEYQKKILDTQLETNKQKLTDLIDSLVEETNTIQELTPAQKEAWKNLSEQSYTEYSQALSKVSETTRTEIEKSTGIVATDTTLPDAAELNASNTSILFGENLKLADITQEEIDNTSTKIKKDTSVENATTELAQEADRGFNSNVEPRKWGVDLVDLLAVGMTGGNSQTIISRAASKVGGWISSYLHFSVPDKGPLSDMDESMPDMIDLMANGIDKNKSKLIKSVRNMSNDVRDELDSINQDETEISKNASLNRFNNSKSNYVFNMNVYPQKLDEQELDNIFNYINKRFGTEY